MKTRSLFLFLFLTTLVAHAQDLIVKKNGSELKCKINREDDLSFYISVKKMGSFYDTYINKTEVARVNYNYKNVNSEQKYVEITAPSPTSETTKNEEHLDKITGASGQVIYGTITSMDTDFYYFTYLLDGKETHAKAKKSDISSIEFHKQQETPALKNDPRYLDKLYGKNGEVIKGNITEEDSIYFHISYKKGSETNIGKAKKTNINKVVYDYNSPTSIGNNNSQSITDKNEFVKPQKNCITVGFLNGGGSLLGADYERMLTEQVSFQIGTGIFGFGTGLNIHFKPKIKSSFLSLQYWHQGIGRYTVQEIVGPNIVFRGKSLLTAQIGAGVSMSQGPNYPKVYQKSLLMLMYSVGFRIPW